MTPPKSHAARAQAVAETRNELEKKILDHIRPLDLTSAEICWMLSEMAYRWSLIALKDEREHRCESTSPAPAARGGINKKEDS